MLRFVRGLFAGAQRSAPPVRKVRLSVDGLEERATPASAPPGAMIGQAVIHEPLLQSHPTQLDIHGFNPQPDPPARVAIVSHY